MHSCFSPDSSNFTASIDLSRASVWFLISLNWNYSWTFRLFIQLCENLRWLDLRNSVTRFSLISRRTPLCCDCERGSTVIELRSQLFLHGAEQKLDWRSSVHIVLFHFIENLVFVRFNPRMFNFFQGKCFRRTEISFKEYNKLTFMRRPQSYEKNHYMVSIERNYSIQ